MQFSQEFIIALMIFILNLVIAFNFKLPAKYVDQYKEHFRIYCISVSVLFIIFIGALEFYYSFVPLKNINLTLYVNTISVFYFFLFAPFIAVLISVFRSLIIEADIYLEPLKQVIKTSVLISLLVIIFIGHFLFRISFSRFIFISLV